MSSVSPNPNPTPQHHTQHNASVNPNLKRIEEPEVESLELNLSPDEQKKIKNETLEAEELNPKSELSLSQSEQKDLNKLNQTQQMNEIEAQAVLSINEFSEEISKIIKNNLENPNFLPSLEKDASINSTDVIKAALLGKEAVDALNPNIGDHIHDINSSIVLSGTLLLISNLANLPEKLDQITKLEETIAVREKKLKELQSNTKNNETQIEVLTNEISELKNPLENLDSSTGHEEMIANKEKKLEELKSNTKNNEKQIEVLNNEITALTKKKDSVTETTYNNLVKATLKAAKNDTKIAAEILEIMGGASTAEKFLTFCGSLLGGIYQIYKIKSSMGLLKEYNEERELILKELNQISAVLSKKTDPALRKILETRKKSLDQQYLENGKNTIEKTLLLSSYTSGFASSGLAIGGYLGAATVVGTAGVVLGATSGVLFLGGLTVGGAYLVLKNREKIHGSGKRLYADTKLKIAKKQEESMKSLIRGNQVKLNLNKHSIRELEREIATRDIYHSEVIPFEIKRLEEKIHDIDHLINIMDPNKKEMSDTNTISKYQSIEEQIKTLDLESEEHAKKFKDIFKNLEINKNSIKLLESNLEKIKSYLEKSKNSPLVKIESYNNIARYLAKKLDLYKKALEQIDATFVKRYNEITKNKPSNPEGIQKQIDKVRDLIRSINQKIAKSPQQSRQQSRQYKALNKALEDYQVIHEHLLNKKDLAIQKIRQKEEMDKMMLANDKRKKCVSISKKINSLISITMQKLTQFKTTLDKLGNRSQELKNRKIDEKYAAELGMSLSQFKKEKEDIKKKLDEDKQFKTNTTNYLKQFPGLIKSRMIGSPSSEELLNAIFDYSTKKVK